MISLAVLGLATKTKTANPPRATNDRNSIMIMTKAWLCLSRDVVSCAGFDEAQRQYVSTESQLK